MQNTKTIVDPIEQEFWAGTAKGELLLRYCNACQKPHWYPRPICPFCGHQETRFEVSTGLGVIYSLTRLRTPDAEPQCIAYIRLDDGVTLLSQVIEFEDTPAQIGQRVQVSFKQGRHNAQLPVFRLVSQEPGGSIS